MISEVQRKRPADLLARCAVIGTGGCCWGVLVVLGVPLGTWERGTREAHTYLVPLVESAENRRQVDVDGIADAPKRSRVAQS